MQIFPALAMTQTSNLTAANTTHAAVGHPADDFYDITFRLNKMLLQNPRHMIAILIGMIAIALNVLVLVALHQVRGWEKGSLDLILSAQKIYVKMSSSQNIIVQNICDKIQLSKSHITN